MENNHFEEFDNVTLLTEKEVFQKIFSEPRKAFEYIHKNRFENYLITILITVGICNAVDNTFEKIIAGTIDNVMLSLTLSVLVGAFLGWISFYLFGGLLSWTGKWYNGRGTTDEFVRILGYANFPTYISLLVTLIQVIFMKVLPTTFLSESLYQIFIYGFVAVSLFIGIWSIALSIIGIAVVQNFSYGKAFLNYITAIAVVAVPLFLIIFMIVR